MPRNEQLRSLFVGCCLYSVYIPLPYYVKVSVRVAVATLDGYMHLIFTFVITQSVLFSRDCLLLRSDVVRTWYECVSLIVTDNKFCSVVSM